jgi:hypothetical protein
MRFSLRMVFRERRSFILASLALPAVLAAAATRAEVLASSQIPSSAVPASQEWNLWCRQQAAAWTEALRPGRGSPGEFLAS